MKKLSMIAVPVLMIFAVLLFGAILVMEEPETEPAFVREQIFAEGGSQGSFLPEDAEKKLIAFANQNGLSMEDWTEDLKNRYRKLDELEEFVLNYPFMKGTEQPVDFSEYEGCTTVPHLLQWDARWGYTEYCGGIMGTTGCGPTCLSMVCIYLLQDTRYTPRYLADFSQERNYCTEGVGSDWSLITAGGAELGLEVTEIPLHLGTISSYLNNGDPIICVVGPGDFTDGGHFLVLTGVEDGRIKLLDPYCIANTEKLWEYETLADQIRNLWVCRLPQTHIIEE